MYLHFHSLSNSESFVQQPCLLKRVMSLVSAVGVLNFGDSGDMKVSLTLLYK